MAKSISAGLRTHLDGTVTSLCTVWKLTRIDGQIFYFTDHDVDIVWDDGAGEATYLAETGYNRTAVASQVGLNVDNMDVEGVFDDDSIKEDELRGGKFDFADIEVNIVNWADLTQDALKMRKGNIGEVSMTPQGIFRAELRGAAQPLMQQMINPYQADCRVDLGSTECSIDINPDVIARLTTYAVGDVVTVPTLATGRTWSHLVTNPSFEQQDAATELTTVNGWTVNSGTWDIINGNADSDHMAHHLLGGLSTGNITQVIDLTKLGIDLVSLDAGNGTARMTIARGNAVSTDTGQMIIQFLDVASAPISTMWDSTATNHTPGTGWTTLDSTSINVPTETRFLSLSFTTVGSNFNDVKLDDITLAYTDATLTDTFQEVYENRLYTCTQAGITAEVQPTFDTTVGQSTDELGKAAEASIDMPAFGSVNDGETVEINGQTYTFKNVLTLAANEILLDTDNLTTLDHLGDAINNGGSLPGSSVATLAHTTVNAQTAAGWQLPLRADALGTAGNSYTITDGISGTGNGVTAWGGGLDGCIWIASEAWTRDAAIYDVINEREVWIFVDEARAVDLWFNNGGFIFETGDNIALVHEIRAFETEDLFGEVYWQVNLFLDAPFPMVPGTKVKLYRGCQKTIEVCNTVFGNAINFRGEPHVPGQDVLMNYPDATD